MSKYGHLFYTKIYEKDLEVMLKHNISKTATHLYIFLSLNFHSYTEFTDHLNDSDIAKKMGTHRTTIMRARAELEDAGLIIEDTETASQKYRYHLPFKAKVDSKANAKRKENDEAEFDKQVEKSVKEREKEYSKTRADMENKLKRRLTESEIITLKRNFDII